jgi:hypothetical protein
MQGLLELSILGLDEDKVDLSQAERDIQDDDAFGSSTMKKVRGSVIHAVNTRVSNL